MKNVLLFMVVVCFSFGAEKPTVEECKQIMGAGVYNQILEDTCHFSGEVSKSFIKMFTIGGCREIMGSELINSVAGDVISDTLPRYKKFGKEVFCKENWKGYDELMEDEAVKKFDLGNIK